MTPSRSWCAALTVFALLLGLLILPATRAQEKPAPIRALLVIGGCCHDYAKQKDLLPRGISERTNVKWTIAYDPDTGRGHKNPIYDNPDWAKGFDVIVHDECSSDVTDPAVINRILEPHRHGLPGVVIHCGMHSYRGEGYPKMTAWYEFTGLMTNAHKAQLPITVAYVDPANPITKDLSDWTTIKEELYNNVTGKLLDTAQPLARGKQTLLNKKGKATGTDDFVVAWTNRYMGKTRVFGTTLGHNNETVSDPRYLDLVTRGMLWAVDKLDTAHLRPASKALP
jgi:type 1 glutamine amidotransferase